MSEYIKTPTTTFGETPLVLQATASTNPGSVGTATAGMGIGAYLLIGALGIGGFFLYRHFKKNKGTPTTPEPEGQ